MKNKCCHRYSIRLLPVIGIVFLLASGCASAPTVEIGTTEMPAIQITPVEGQAVVIVDVAPLRSRPDTQAETVRSLSEGDLVNLIGVSPSMEWYLVREVSAAAGQDEAWILAAFVDQVENLTSTPSPVPDTEPTDTPEPTVITPTNTPTRRITPTEPAGTDPSPTVAEAVATFIQNGHCRRGPGTVYDSVTALEEGQRVTMVGRNDDSSWWWIQLPNSQAKCWVSTIVVEVSGTSEELPLGPIPPTPTATATLIPPSTPTATATLLPPRTATATTTLVPALTPTSTSTSTPSP